MKDLAGTMKEKVEHWRRTPARDAYAGAGGDWTLSGLIWAAAEPDGEGALGDDGDRRARWRLVLRPCDVAVGDRIVRVLQKLDVQQVIVDPRLPDRVTVVAEVAP